MSEGLRVAICHTRLNYVGGSEKYIWSLAGRLLAAGHDVHFFGSRWEPFPDPRLRIHRVPRLRGLPGAKVLSFAYLSRALLRRESFDVIHGFTKTFHQDVYTDGSGCQADYQEYLFAGDSPWRRAIRSLAPKQWATIHVERRRFRPGACRRILVMSRMVKEQIHARYELPDPVVEVLYNGIEIDHFHPRRRQDEGPALRREQGADPGTRVLLFVGNDYRRKGLAAVIEAVRAEEASGRPWTLWVVGRDRRPEPYRALAADLGHRVRFLGPQREVAPLHAAADAFVLASAYDVFGNAVLEAMASATPPIVSSRAGASEIVADGRDGLVVSPRDGAPAIARALEILSDTERRHAMGMEARATAERFDWDRHFERVLEVYREIARAKRGDGAGG
ncbi:MAG: glycosyltransferase family 4 protein [Planctomycetes bacterium]|nr:glycosyltransferase family 4 protein [Planctomycetota bacterium]